MSLKANICRYYIFGVWETVLESKEAKEAKKQLIEQDVPKIIEEIESLIEFATLKKQMVRAKRIRKELEIWKAVLIKK
jgi:hypothetical protein